jgi:hypothetical protein
VQFLADVKKLLEQIDANQSGNVRGVVTADSHKD